MIAPASPAPAASATPAAIVGPCSQGAIASIADRPGVGRALTVNGSPCVVPVGGVVLELGFRQQMTHAAAAVSTLVTYPQPLVRWGIGGGNEIVLAPSLDYSQRYGANLEVAPFVPASGLQDAGLGFKRQLEDRPWFQSALEAFVTLPTGYPQGPNGFSAGMVTYLVGYSVVVPVGPVISLTTTQNLQSTGFIAYQPSLGVSFAIGARGAFLLQDQITTPASSTGGTSNRAFAGIQRTISPNVVLDAEYEVNALPQPGFAQHAFGGGAVLRF